MSRVHVRVDVTADEMGLPGNRHHCAIANAIMLADPDIVRVRVDDEQIRFSRRSTGTRFEYVTPAKAAAFIHEFDKLVATRDSGGKVRQMTAEPFTLQLTSRDLVREHPQRQRSAPAAIRRAAVRAFGPGVEAPSAPATAKRAAPVRRTAAPHKRPSQRI
jgi:hypothetical protein